MSELPHLDTERWTALLEQRAAPSERAALLSHLDEPCDACEQFLAEALERGDLDALDGRTDEVLLGLKDARAEAFDELGFQKLTRAIAARRSRRRAWLGAAVALAASLALAVIARRPAEEGDPSHLKGSPPPIAPRARLVVAEAGRVLADHDRIAIGATLVFRIELPGPGCFALSVASGGGEDKPLLEAPICSTAAGPFAVAKDGQALGYTVDGSDRPSLVFTLSVAGQSGGDRITLEVSE